MKPRCTENNLYRTDMHLHKAYVSLKPTRKLA